jgi:restriction system protein
VTRRRRGYKRAGRGVSWRVKAAWWVCVVAVLIGLHQAAVDAAGRWGVFVDLGVILAANVVGGVVLWRVWLPLLRRWQVRRPGYREINLPAVDRMTGTQFEEYVAGLLRRDGWLRVRVSGGAGDFGADVIAYDEQGRKLVVQCKRYNPTRAVGSADMQRFLGTVRLMHGAHFAWFVTSSRFTDDAARLARAGLVHTVDRAGLADWSSRPLLVSA